MIILARSLLEWKRLVILPCDSGISEIELVSPPDNCLLYFFSSSPIATWSFCFVVFNTGSWSHKGN